jgi:hypothetical protein
VFHSGGLGSEPRAPEGHTEDSLLHRRQLKFRNQIATTKEVEDAITEKISGNFVDMSGVGELERVDSCGTFHCDFCECGFGRTKPEYFAIG